MSRIVIIGLSGYLGSRIAYDLIQKGHDVIGVFRNRPTAIDNSLENFSNILQGDVTDSGFLQKIVKTEPEIVIYLISLNHKDSEDSIQKSLEVNVAPLIELGRLLSSAKYFKRLVYMSTMQVYGKLNPGEFIDENFPIKPNNIYGLTHYFCEQGLNFLYRVKKLPSVSLRLSNGYGFPVFSSSDCWSLVINDMCFNAVHNGVIKLTSDGSPQRDFIHISDISRAIEMIAISPDVLPRVMNLASEKTLSIIELAQLISRIFMEEYNIEIPIELPRGSGLPNPENYVLKFKFSCALLKEKIEFNEVMPLESGIKDLIVRLIEKRDGVPMIHAHN